MAKTSPEKLAAALRANLKKRKAGAAPSPAEAAENPPISGKTPPGPGEGAAPPAPPRKAPG